MHLPLYYVDAFCSRPFAGNPAAVCPLPSWLPDDLMQSIAAENNLAETAFLVKEADGYRIRWFTPTVEVDLCGHATLASAFVLAECMGLSEHKVVFASRSGVLEVLRDGDRYTLDFPSRPGSPIPVSPELTTALGPEPLEVLAARDVLAVLENEEQVRSLRPDMKALQQIDTFAVIATAPGNDSDFVSRFFAPSQGIPEDPVTGSAHCTLTPYWSRRLGKQSMFARQISARGGELWVEDRGDRVRISGQGRLYLTGFIHVPPHQSPPIAGTRARVIARSRPGEQASASRSE
jgi:PhzF family phenazine biosynthesis protein